MSYRFDFDLLEQISPFSFILDESLAVVHQGKMMDRLNPEMLIFPDAFLIEEPAGIVLTDFPSLLAFVGRPCIIRSRKGPVWPKLAGNFTFSTKNNFLVFSGSPKFTEGAMSGIAPYSSERPASADEEEKSDDVSDLKKEENQQIRTQQKFYDMILDNIPADVAVFNPNFEFQYINARAIRNPELRNWLIGRNELDYWRYKGQPLDKGYKRIEGFQNAIKDKERTIVEEVLFPGTPEEKTFWRITHPYFEGEQLVCLLTYGVEVTDLKKSNDELLRKNNELVKINAELDTFVYSVSHNLRSPLTSIRGLANLILSYDLSKSEQINYVQEIQHSIDRLDRTIMDIIDYSKNARLDVIQVTLDPEEIVRNAFQDVKYYNKTNVICTLSKKGEVAFVSDLKRINSLVTNLVSNSIKYHDPEKPDPFLDIAIDLTDESCKLVFTDNGIGIPKVKQERVFDMFYRASNRFQGTGLGLFMAKEIVKKLHGQISLDSEEGKGTTITVTLPNLHGKDPKTAGS